MREWRGESGRERKRERERESKEGEKEEERRRKGKGRDLRKKQESKERWDEGEMRRWIGSDKTCDGSGSLRCGCVVDVRILELS